MFSKKHIAIGLFMIFATLLTSTTEATSAPTPQKIPNGIIEASNKFGLWRDIYNSKQKVVVYSYISGSTCPYQSQEFHNKITSAAGASGGKYKARPTGPDKLEKEINAATAKLNEKAKNITNPAQAKAINKEIQAFNKLMSFTNKCTLKACIIDPSKGEYILLNRNSAEVVGAMKSY
ncbi:hypothetical protein IKU74_03865 [bacterium]|nr:hypothetical protein [bacterium]